MAPYLLDANFFITAHRFWYPFDVIPSFWSRVRALAHSGKIASIDKVGAEIAHGNDVLKDWIASELPSGFFKDSSLAINEYVSLAGWAANQVNYLPSAKAEFLDADEADAWLIAMAMHGKHAIVTNEVSNPGMKRRIAIPEPCNHFGLAYMDMITMFRRLAVTI